MGFIRIIVWVVWVSICSGNANADMFRQHCLTCHTKQKIPNDLIYRRYLMRYSTPERIEKAIFDYLRTPRQEDSIMPPQFFLKFPMKQPVKLDDKSLKEAIRAYLYTYDIRKKLRLKR